MRVLLPRSRRQTLRWVLIAAVVVSLPVVAHLVYRSMTAMPEEVVLATGPEGGRYRILAAELGRELERRHGLRVRYLHTRGSRENLRALREGEVDFGLFQQSTDLVDEGPPAEADHEPSFLANLYREPLHLLCRRGEPIVDGEALRGRRVALGHPGSGDHPVNLLVLQHLGLGEDDIDPVDLAPRELAPAFERGELDAALITMAEGSPVMRRMLGPEGPCELWELPAPGAFLRRHFFLDDETLPRGSYSMTPMVPARDTRTAASAAQLLAAPGVSTRLVEALTEIVHDPDFALRCRLRELYDGGAEFSRLRPAFPEHEGAQHFHEPQLRPLLDPDFVDASEGIRSFLVSLGVAAFLLYRWWKRRRDVQEEHALEAHFQELLQIEQEQVDLDQGPGGADLELLQELLDRVTRLRTEALSRFTVHQLNEDQGVDIFLEMCHALSSKISDKIGRQRLDLALAELRAALEEHRPA